MGCESPEIQFRFNRINEFPKQLQITLPSLYPFAGIKDLRTESNLLCFRRSRREAMAAHDFTHLCPVWRISCRRVDHLG
jgi:hypothetical protein